MTLYVNNMVCGRCVAIVKFELKQLGLIAYKVKLGEIQFSRKPSADKVTIIINALYRQGFEVVDEDKKKLVERIKLIIAEQIRFGAGSLRTSYVELMTTKLKKDYASLNKLFSEVEGLTIEKFVDFQKTEIVKELIVYDELNLSKIASELNYKNSSHLKTQFIRITGITPSFYKELAKRKRMIMHKKGDSLKGNK